MICDIYGMDFYTGLHLFTKGILFKVRCSFFFWQNVHLSHRSRHSSMRSFHHATRKGRCHSDGEDVCSSLRRREPDDATYEYYNKRTEPKRGNVAVEIRQPISGESRCDREGQEIIPLEEIPSTFTFSDKQCNNSTKKNDSGNKQQQSLSDLFSGSKVEQFWENNVLA